jgi:SRSO17 transposase
MDIVSSFADLLQVFTVTMTPATSDNLRELVIGWVFAPRRTIMGMLRAGGVQRHHSAFHRIFSDARWSIDLAGLAVYDLIRKLLPQDTVFLAGDDTLLNRRGLKMFGAGMHRDPLLSSRGFTVVRWGHCWVVLCVVIESPRTPGRYFALPILARLYLNKKSAEKWNRAYHTKPEMMLAMLQRVRAHDPEQSLHFLGDSAFTSSSMLKKMPEAIAVTGRIGCNSRIHAPAPPRKAGRGRPRVRGERLDTPDEMLDAKGLRRVDLKLYESTEYKIRLAEQEGYLFLAPNRPIKVVAIEHQRGGRGREVFYSTEIDAEAQQILGWFSWRWPIEVTFHDSKQHLGLGEAENRKTKAVRRTVPTGLLMYTLVVLWHECIRKKPAPRLRKWAGKDHASFAEMVAALRIDSLGEFKRKHLSTPGLPPGIHKILKPLEYLIALAA